MLRRTNDTHPDDGKQAAAEDQPRSRRALLAGALGGIGAWAAASVGRVAPARAANGEAVIQGHTNSATATTLVQNSTAGHAALMGSATATTGASVGVRGTTASSTGSGILGDASSGMGVHGQSVSGIGVAGTSGLIGVRGRSTGGGTGVLGQSNGWGVVGIGQDIGVWGSGVSEAGVEGSSESGPGVSGHSDESHGVTGKTIAGSPYAAVYGDAAIGFGTYGQSISNVGARGASKTLYGVYGQSEENDGVVGAALASGRGVRGSSTGGTGTYGFSGAFDSGPAGPPKTGVYGYAAQDAASRGVIGESTAGVGVFGKATSGHALRTSGRVKIDRVSGVAAIKAGSTSVTVTPGVNVVSGSFVLLTPRANIGSRALWFTTNASTNTFTIRISSARPKSTKIAWLLLG